MTPEASVPMTPEASVPMTPEASVPMENATWRQRAQHYIDKALDGVTTRDEAELRRILFDAYPFGERQYTPYKVWLEEVRAEIDRRLHPNSVTLTARVAKCDLERLDAWNRASFENGGRKP